MSRWSKLLGTAALMAALGVAPAFALEAYRVDVTATTPAIAFDPASGVLDITGPSQTGTGSTFYSPLIESLERYAASPLPGTVVNIRLSAVDEQGKKSLLDILKKLEALHRSGSVVTIRWYYPAGDDDLLELGEDLEAGVTVPFEFVEAAG